MKNWKAILGVIAVFVLGMVAGGLVVGGLFAKRIHRVTHGQSAFTAEEVTHFLKRRLDLDAAQQEKVIVIVRESQHEVLNIRHGCDQQVRGVISNAVTEMDPILRPNQQDKLNDLVAERYGR
jgi:hypothetical protein